MYKPQKNSFFFWENASQNKIKLPWSGAFAAGFDAASKHEHLLNTNKFPAWVTDYDVTKVIVKYAHYH